MRVEKPFNLVTNTIECVKDLSYMVKRSLPHARMERLTKTQIDNIDDSKYQPTNLVQTARKKIRTTLLDNLENKKQNIDSKSLQEILGIDTILNKIELDQHGLEAHKKYSTLAIIILTSMLVLAVSNK